MSRFTDRERSDRRVSTTHKLFVLLFFSCGLVLNCNSQGSAVKKTHLPDGYLKIAHRGASGTCPENTLAAFAAAVEQGADMVELDVYLSADSQVVVLHDKTVDRTTNGHGEVGALTVAELAALDAGAGEKVPTLEEVFALTNGKCGVNVELKGPGTAAPVSELIRRTVRERAAALEDFVVSSFDHPQLSELKKIAPEIRRAPLFGDKLPADFLQTARALEAWSVNLNQDTVTDSLVAACHQAGIRVLVWTVNEPEEIARLKKLAVDGIIGNYPDRL